MAAKKALKRPAPPRGAIFGAHRALTAKSITPASADVRFLDAVVTIVVAAATVLWVATRPSTQALGWAVFWMLLGGLMAVEGSGELRYGGFGVLAANASYLALRVTGFANVTPATQAAFAEAGMIADRMSASV